jgi:hypothetical protein
MNDWMLEFHIKMGPFYSNVQLIDLEIINSISVPQINASTQTYILENLSKSFLMDPVTLWCRRPRSLVSICRRAMFLWIVVCPFVLFLLAIVLSVLLRYMDSDYPLVSSNSSIIVVNCNI